MDEIRIKDLEVYCNHGVFPEERTLGQKFMVSAVLYTDTRKAGQSDNLMESIDYGQMCHRMTKFMKEHTYQLIESVAEQLATELLLTVEGLEAIELEVKKPWAPVGLPLDTVSVKIHRMWHRVYIALGSNMGDKEEYLQHAVEHLKAVRCCEVVQVSSFIRTKPYGVLDQEDFLNGALELRTLLTPEELLEELHKIEAGEGRVREMHWGPRTLDLDILFYDSEVIDTRELHIPHIDLQNRDFVLEPMNQIAPFYRHPVLHKTINQLLSELE